MRDDVMARYDDERLPRYTIYPTSSHFTTEVGADDYAAWLPDVPAGATASLYLHVPFCRALCTSYGRPAGITRQDGSMADYVALLRREVNLIAGRLREAPQVRHVHFGGALTVMAPDTFVDLVATMRARFPFDPAAEIALEIDPLNLAPDMIGALRWAGATRAILDV